MVNLDVILNWTIPPLAVLFFLWIFYKALHRPFEGIGEGIKKIISYIKGDEEEFEGSPLPVQYE